MTYDPNNTFARIIRGEIPCMRVHEDEYTLAFHDINPKAPIHVLVIPKGAYTDMEDFVAHASDQEVVALQQAVTKVAHATGITESGYRCLCNVGANAGQEVLHLHVHVFGDPKLGHMLQPTQLSLSSREFHKNSL